MSGNDDGGSMIVDDAGMTDVTAAPPASSSSSSCDLPADKVRGMIEACRTGTLHVIQGLMNENPLYASQQDTETGMSPLMASAASGNVALCRHLLEAGAPWNAVDRRGLCAGNYATDSRHWVVVNELVDWGVRAELILGTVERNRRDEAAAACPNNNVAGAASGAAGGSVPTDQQPSTKPDYLRQRLHYTSDGRALLDSDDDAVMMEWERPLMQAHAQVLMERGDSAASSLGTGKSVLNVGFGMGIIDGYLQGHDPSLHVIIEAHPDVYKRMLNERWNEKPNVRICFGKWQDVLPRLIAEGLQIDAVFYDTYGEHYLDLEDFHVQMSKILSKPNGVYSFFNGLAPDNIFFHGVACQCVKLQLSRLGLDSDFYPCEIQVKDEVWEGIRRKYWHGRDTYYLPKCTWNAQYLATGAVRVDPTGNDDPRKNKASSDHLFSNHHQEGDDPNTATPNDADQGKRQRIG